MLEQIIRAIEPFVPHLLSAGVLLASIGLFGIFRSSVPVDKD